MASILIVDDRPTNRDYLSSLLSCAGHRVLQANDGLEGLEMARRESPDLLLTDILMPKMDGYELVRELRSDARTAALPVILHTGHYQEGEARQLVGDLQVCAVLTKPAEPQAVLAAVGAALESRRSFVTQASPSSASQAERLESAHRRILTEKLAEAGAELRSSRSRMGTFLELSTRIASEEDPAILLDLACREARRLVSARYAGLGILGRDGSRFEPFLVIGPGEAACPSVPPDIHDPWIGRIFSSRDCLRGVLETGHRLVPGTDELAFVASPIASASLMHGFLFACGREGGRDFDSESEDVVGALASLVGVAYENGLRRDQNRSQRDRLRAEMAERRRAEATLKERSEGLETIKRSLMLQLTTGVWECALAALLEGARSVTSSRLAFAGFLQGESLLLIDDSARRCQSPALEGLAGRVLATGAAVNVHSGAGWVWPGEETPRAESLLAVPVLRGTEVAGLLGVVDRPGGYSAGEEAALQSLCGAAGLLYESHCRERREWSLQRQLRQAQKLELLGVLAASVAHDFNNLLTAIGGYSDLALEEIRGESPLRRNVTEIRRVTERAADLTRQLLVFSRRTEAEACHVDLEKTVQGVSSLLRRLLGEGVDLVIEPAGERSTVRMAAGQLEQILMNLAVNARDAMPGGGRLAIRTERVSVTQPVPAGRSGAIPPGSYVKLTVTDTGTGMDAETRERIFEPFFTTKAPERGTGLGLSTVLGIVQQGGGRIDCSSAPGRGTRFEIHLPLVGAPLTEPAGPPAEGLPAGRETILVLEDDRATREVVVAILTTCGYRVLAAADGEEALRIAAEHAGAVDLILADVMMPGLSGPEVTARLLAVRPSARVLYQTGYEEEMIRQTMSLAPDAPIIRKPFGHLNLARKVREVLDA